MPNWCNNFITFVSDGTVEGNACLVDLHNKIVNTKNLMCQLTMSESNNFRTDRNLWEVDLVRYGFGVDINSYQRGYIYYIGDIDISGTQFDIECEDAWSANIQFWLALLQYAYNGRIKLLFQAAEPGMGIYETNNQAILPRYNVDVYADSFKDLLRLDKLWDWSDPLFPKLISPNVGIYQGQWVTWRSCKFDENGEEIFEKRYIPPTINYWNNYEGDESDVLSDINDNEMTIGSDTTIETIRENPAFNVHDWEYVDTDQIIASEMFCAAICDKISGDNMSQDYGLVQPIYDNFMTGGNTDVKDC